MIEQLYHIGLRLALIVGLVYVAVGCADRYLGVSRNGAVAAYGLDKYQVAEGVGELETPVAKVKGQYKRKTDAEAIAATGKAAEGVINAGLEKAVLGGQIDADKAVRLRSLMLEELRVRTGYEAKTEKAGSR